MSEFWPFPKIAKKAAEWQHGNAWPAFEDECLKDLVADLWLNRFDGRTGHPHVYYEYGYGKPEPIKRELVWSTLGPGKPVILRDVGGGIEPPLNDFADGVDPIIWEVLGYCFSGLLKASAVEADLSLVAQAIILNQDGAASGVRSCLASARVCWPVLDPSKCIRLCQ